MTFKSRTSPIALAAAFAFAMGSTAFAATMVGGQEVSDADLPMVTAHCAALTDDMAASDDAAGIDQDTTAAVPQADDSGTPDSSATDDLAASPDAGSDTGTDDFGSDSTASDSTSAGDDAQGQALDLAAITAADCEAAGL